MIKKMVEVVRVPVCVEKGKKYQVELIGNEVAISKEVKVGDWLKVTNDCVLDFRYSQHSSSCYIAIIDLNGHSCNAQGKLAAVIGMKGIQPQADYKVEIPTGASMSFVIYKKNKERK